MEYIIAYYMRFGIDPSLVIHPQIEYVENIYARLI